MSAYQDDMFGGVVSTIPLEDIQKDLSWAVNSDFKTLHSVDEVVEMLDELRQQANKPLGEGVLRIPAVDTETMGLHGSIVGASFSCSPDRAFYLPFNHLGYAYNLPIDEVMPLLKKFLEEQPCAYANASYDWQVFADFDIDCNIGDDTLLMSYVYDVSQMSHGLKQQTKLRLGLEMIEISELFPKPVGRKKIANADIDFAKLNPDSDAVRIYACSDAACTLQLREWFAPKMKEFEFIYDVERRLIKRMAKMEKTGFRVDKAALEAENEEYKAELVEDLENLFTMFGRRIEINSPKQLAAVLFNDLGLPVLETTKSGAPSTSSKVLQQLADDYPVVAALINYKSKSKLQNAFLEKLPQDVGPDGRIHTSFKQAGAKSGRICSQQPNLMQIPKKGGSFIRKAFIPRDGYYIFDIDYSQIEYRVFSSMAHEESLMEAFTTGVDFHSRTASMVFNIPMEDVTDAKRKLGKIANFAILYGVTPYGLSKQMGISEGEAEQIMTRYFQSAPNIQAYVEHTKDEALRNGYIKTYFGRKRALPELQIPALREKALRKAVNTTIQGTAADILKIAMVRVDKMLNEKYADGKADLLVCVHDELVFEVSNDIPKEQFYEDVRACMEIQLPGFVPIKADAEWGPTWGDLQAIGHSKNKNNDIKEDIIDEDEEPELKIDIDNSVFAELKPVKNTPAMVEVPVMQYPSICVNCTRIQKSELKGLRAIFDSCREGTYSILVSYMGRLLLYNRKVAFDAEISRNITSLCKTAEVVVYDAEGRTV